MNIFFLALCVKQSAQFHFDKHVVKMIIELAQLLSTAHWMLDQKSAESFYAKDLIYRKTHYNHPSAKWVRLHVNNYYYVATLGLALCNEYRHRYGTEKTHKTQSKLEFLLDNPPAHINRSCSLDDFSEDNPYGVTLPLPLAMPIECKIEGDTFQDGVNSYRNYYQSQQKEHLTSWKKRNKPDWFL